MSKLMKSLRAALLLAAAATPAMPQAQYGQQAVAACASATYDTAARKWAVWSSRATYYYQVGNFLCPYHSSGTIFHMNQSILEAYDKQGARWTSYDAWIGTQKGTTQSDGRTVPVHEFVWADGSRIDSIYETF